MNIIIIVLGWSVSKSLGLCLCRIWSFCIWNHKTRFEPFCCYKHKHKRSLFTDFSMWLWCFLCDFMEFFTVTSLMHCQRESARRPPLGRALRGASPPCGVYRSERIRQSRSTQTDFALFPSESTQTGNGRTFSCRGFSFLRNVHFFHTSFQNQEKSGWCWSSAPLRLCPAHFMS